MNKKERMVLYFLCFLLILGIVATYIRRIKEEHLLQKIKVEYIDTSYIFPIDINKASLEELIKIPGIGPVTAKRIVEERKKRPFKTLQELKRVKGIGDKKLNIIKKYVIIKNG